MHNRVYHGRSDHGVGPAAAATAASCHTRVVVAIVHQHALAWRAGHARVVGHVVGIRAYVVLLGVLLVGTAMGWLLPCVLLLVWLPASCAIPVGLALLLLVMVVLRGSSCCWC